MKPGERGCTKEREKERGREKEFSYRQIILSHIFYAGTYMRELVAWPNKKLGELLRVTFITWRN